MAKEYLRKIHEAGLDQDNDCQADGGAGEPGLGAHEWVGHNQEQPQRRQRRDERRVLQRAATSHGGVGRTRVPSSLWAVNAGHERSPSPVGRHYANLMHHFLTALATATWNFRTWTWVVTEDPPRMSGLGT